MALLEAPEPGGTFHDPAAGTGGLMRAAALTLRLQGADPHEYMWSMNDVDPLAVACCAVNATVWSLGPHVLISRSDTLTTGDGSERAARHRYQLLDSHERLMYALTGAQAVIEAGQIVGRLMRPAS